MKRVLVALVLLCFGVAAPSSAFWQSRLQVSVAGGGGGGSCNGFTPTSLGANLIAWYKADVGALNGGTGVQATTGQSVDTWQDQSGNGNTMTPHGFNSPLMGTLNGLPAINWVLANTEGLNTNGFTAGGSVAWGTGSTGSIFLLAAPTSASGGGGPGYGPQGMGAYSSDANSASWPVFDGTTTKFGYVHANDQQYLQTFTSGTEARFGGIFDGTNFTPYLNNVAGTTHAVSFSFASPGSIAANAQAGLNGPMRELLFINRTLTTQERSDLDCYLVSRQ